MINKEERKQNNKNMLKASLSAGGFALFILTSFTFITIGGIYIGANKGAKADEDYSYKKDAETFLKGLTYIANKQYQEKIGVSTVSNYVTSISSIEYKNDGLNYCAVAKKHGLESSLVVVNVSYNFETIDNCVSLVNKEYMSKSYFTVSSTLYKEETSEEAKNNISNTFKNKLDGFNCDKPYIFNVYEARIMFAASLTYKTSDDSYNSLVLYNPLSSNEPFKITYEANKTMYYALESLVKTK